MLNLVCLVCLVFWVNETNRRNTINKTNQINQIDPIVPALEAERKPIEKSHSPEYAASTVEHTDKRFSPYPTLPWGEFYQAERCESGRIGQSRKLLSWQRDRGFDPHPLRQTKLARADGVPGTSVLFIWFVLFVWFEERKKLTNQRDQINQSRLASAPFPSTHA